jgi:hypothetical protein
MGGKGTTSFSAWVPLSKILFIPRNSSSAKYTANNPEFS